ncbi:class I SAM-dependent methyltransferase [Deinococcus sp.]|uniref:class I SAM-dependent methyltransferase n=1 Tax=Deinococcus sp. TaxID=47478 RepID=UPI003B5BEE27
MTQPSAPSPAALQAARTYERFMVPAMFAPWAAALLDHAGVQPGDRLLDVACGTGTVARQAAVRVGSGGAVSALDLNPAMLAVARESAAPEAPQIDWRQGSAQALPFADAAFSAVLCQQGLQFFPDGVAALREMRRVLEPGGRAALLVSQAIESNPLYGQLNEVGRRLIGVPIYAAPFSLGDPVRLEAMLTEAGFSEVSVTPQARTVRFPSAAQFIGGIVQGAAAALPALAAMNEEQRQHLSEQLQTDLADWITAHTVEGELVDEMAVYIALGRG